MAPAGLTSDAGSGDALDEPVPKPSWRRNDGPPGVERTHECEVREAYTDAEGLIEHNTHILEARTKLFKDYADNHFMTVYGEPSQPLLDLLDKHKVGFKWFSFAQGLDRAPVLLTTSR